MVSIAEQIPVLIHHAKLLDQQLAASRDIEPPIVAPMLEPLIHHSLGTEDAFGSLLVETAMRTCQDCLQAQLEYERLVQTAQVAAMTVSARTKQLVSTVSLLGQYTQQTDEVDSEGEESCKAVNLSAECHEEVEHIPLQAHLFGAFRVYQSDQLIHAWPNGKSQLLMKYMLLHRHYPIPKERLMALFWPELELSSARNNLNVTIYSLRQILPKPYAEFSHILFKQDCYYLNPLLDIWTDVEAFDDHLASAKKLQHHKQQEEAIAQYALASSLYKGDILPEERYDDWVVTLRQHYQSAYLEVLYTLLHHFSHVGEYKNCIDMAQKILVVDCCDEYAHRLLIQSYRRLGQRHLAIRQYHQYVDVIKRELELSPSDEIQQLFIALRGDG